MPINKANHFRDYWYEVGKICFAMFFIFFLILSLSSLFFQTTFGQDGIVISFFLSFLLAWLLVSRKWKHFWGALGFLTILTGIGYAVLYFLLDPSVDGNTYHSEAILGILGGKSLFSMDYISRNTYYPKIIEALFSGFSAITDTLDAGRIFKLILMVLSGINVVVFLRKVWEKGWWKKWWRIALFTIIIVVNPVVMYQFFTLYIDDVLYLLLVNVLIYFFL